MLVLFVTEVSFAIGFSGSDITRSQHVTKNNVLCVFMFVCMLQNHKFS